MTDFSYRSIPDWPRLRKRYEAFWRGEVADNCVIAHIQNPNPNQPVPEPWMLEATEEKYTDPSRHFRLQTWRRTAWNWHADLFRYRTPSWGPNVFAGLAGAQPKFGSNTVWHEPPYRTFEEAEQAHFDESNTWWRKLLAMVDYYAEACAGFEQLGTVDLGGIADVLSTLIPVETFLIATAEEPDRMRDLALRLAHEFNQAFDLLWPRLTRHNDGVANWMPVWSERPMVTVQDDMAINFSPALYAEVFLPALRVIAGNAERCVLHWHDGCDHHLETLLTVPEIDVIQYGHDPNSPPFRNKLPQMRRIQAVGKKLFISCVEAEDAEFFIRRLDPRGLMMIINTSDDEASRCMADNVCQWTEQRLREGAIES